MKKTMIVMATLTVLTTLTACSRSGSRTYDADRSESAYRSAMSDYSAGRLDAARKGFIKAISYNPLNAAARFQLACLLQDHGGEPLAAYVEYQAFLSIDPVGDKSRIASERAQICLRLYQNVLMKNSGGAESDAAVELEKLRSENNERRTRIVGLEKDLAEANETINDVTRENDRLRTLIAGFAVDNDVSKRDITREAELFGADEDEVRSDIMTEAAEISRIARAEDASNGRASSLLPKQSVDAKAKRDAKRQSESNAPNAAQKNVIPRPATYTIAEGDTLYRLAQRFYGRRSAWEMIRNANKEKISNDGKLRVGDVIKLP